MEEPKIKSLREQHAETVNIIVIIARMLSMPTELCLCWAPGENRYGPFLLAAFVGTLIYAGHTRDIQVYRYALAMVVMAMIQRLNIFIRWLRGIRQYSGFEGHRWLANLLLLGWLGFLANPLLCGLIGWSLISVSINLSKLWWVSGGAMAFLGVTQALLDAKRRQMIIDTGIEMEWLARNGK
jgi:hypothetical protein